MQFIYFDETKFSPDNPFFFIGGIILNEKNISHIEQELMDIQYNFFQSHTLDTNTELHGHHIFNGKGVFRGYDIAKRLSLFNQISELLIKYQIPIRIISINAHAHRANNNIRSEYNLGLQLALERFCDYLDEINDIGMVFGDYEQDEMRQSILDFSYFKSKDTTAHKYGNSSGRTVKNLKDTIYFTQSHYSRFLQTADMILYMANRYENKHITEKWHDKELEKIWNNLKNNTNYFIQRWL